MALGRPLRRLVRALLLRPLGGRRGPGARRHPRRPRLVHHPGARPRRGAALGPPRLGPGQGLALGGLAGRRRPGLRRRGRGLPVDAVLRLRRLPADGHRDPDWADGAPAAAAQRRVAALRASAGVGFEVAPRGAYGPFVYLGTAPSLLPSGSESRVATRGPSA